MMNGDNTQVSIQCPYCGEQFTTFIDPSAGSQQYIEDCYVCCRPINFNLVIGLDGELEYIEVKHENET